MTPAEEHDARLKAVRAVMEERGLTALLLPSPEDVYYLTGLDHLGYFAVTLLVLPIEGPPLLVARGMEAPTVEVQAPQCVHVAYEDGADPAVAAMEALRRAGSARGRVGVDRSTMYLPLDVWKGIRTGLPEVR